MFMSNPAAAPLGLCNVALSDQGFHLPDNPFYLPDYYGSVMPVDLIMVLYIRILL